MNLEMTEKIDLVYQENVAIISICNPPVNALSVEVRKGLLDALKEAKSKAAARKAKAREYKKFKVLLRVINIRLNQ